MKPSWTEVVVFALLLGFALVMAHGWPWAAGTEADASSITDWLTSLGTVGAVVYSLWSMQQIKKEQRQERITSLSGLVWIVDSAISNLEFAARQVCNEKMTYEDFNIDTLKGCAESVRQALAIPFHQKPFHECVRDLNVTLDNLRSALPMLENVIAGGNIDREHFKQTVDFAQESFTKAMSSPVFHRVTRPVTAYWM